MATTKARKTKRKTRAKKVNIPISGIIVRDPPTAAAMISVSIETLIDMKRKHEITYAVVRNKYGWGVTDDAIKEYLSERLVLRIDKKEKTKAVDKQ